MLSDAEDGCGAWDGEREGDSVGEGILFFLLRLAGAFFFGTFLDLRGPLSARVL